MGDQYVHHSRIGRVWYPKHWQYIYFWLLCPVWLRRCQAFSANGGDFPFKDVVLGMLAVSLDVFLRGCFLAYSMTILKSYVILIPAIYIAIMLIVVIILLLS